MLKNLLTLCGSLLFFLLLLEFLVFRLVIPATDMPENQSIEGVIRFEPNQRGIFRVKHKVKAEYRINQNGWNSAHAKYEPKRSQKMRIAAIGDSFVEAVGVDYDQSFAEQLESLLGPEQNEVYRFGISGAPLSQYLHMFRKEVLKYSPDWVVFMLIHNDFDESYRFLTNRYGSSFLKLRPEADGSIKEIPPVEYRKKPIEFLRHSALFRYIVYQQKFNPKILKRLIFGGEQGAEYQANIDTHTLAQDEAMNEKVADYVFGQIKALSTQHNVKVLLLMDGDRKSIHAGQDSQELYKTGALSLNRLAGRLAQKHGLTFIDLHPVFEADYEKHGRKFNSEVDAHWNEYGHEVIAKTLREALRP